MWAYMVCVNLSVCMVCVCESECVHGVCVCESECVHGVCVCVCMVCMWAQVYGIFTGLNILHTCMQLQNGGRAVGRQLCTHDVVVVICVAFI